jgi:hypothetical protein
MSQNLPVSFVQRLLLEEFLRTHGNLLVLLPRPTELRQVDGVYQAGFSAVEHLLIEEEVAGEEEAAAFEPWPMPLRPASVPRVLVVQPHSFVALQPWERSPVWERQWAEKWQLPGAEEADWPPFFVQSVHSPFLSLALTVVLSTIV